MGGIARILFGSLSLFVAWLVPALCIAAGWVVLERWALVGPRSPAAFAGLVGSGALSFFIGVGLARCTTRLFPSHWHTARRPGCGASLLLFALLAAIWPVAQALEGPLEPFRFGPTLGGGVIALGLAIGAIPLYLGRDRLLDRPFVLVLRRFSSASERSLLPELSALLPPGRRLAFLSGPATKLADWDPFLFGFGSLRLGAGPVVIRTRDADWEDAVRELAGRAETVIFDVTDWSDSLAREREILEVATPPDRVLVTEVLREDSTRPSGLPAAALRTDWRSALPRLVPTLLFTLSVLAYFAFLLPFLAWTFGLPTGPVFVAVAGVAGGVLLIWQRWFGRPRLDRPSRLRLRRELAARVVPPGAER